MSQRMNEWKKMNEWIKWMNKYRYKTDRFEYTIFLCDIRCTRISLEHKHPIIIYRSFLGWGVREKMVPADIQTRNYELAKNMQEIHVSLLPFRKYCRGVKEKGKHCIGAMTADRYLNGACIGDSGSPYICENETGKFLVGIVVGGSGSCEPMSLIVTDVNSYAAWIWGAKRLLNRKYN